MMLYREEPLEQTVHHARAKEFVGIQKSATFKAINQAIFFFSAPIVSFTTFMVYLALDSNHTYASHSNDGLIDLTVGF